MRRRLGSFVFFALSSALLSAQGDKGDIEKRIASIAALIQDSKLDRAVAEASELVAAHAFEIQAQMAAFQTNIQAYQQDPSGSESARRLDQALRHLNLARRIDPDDYEAWEASVSFWDPNRIDLKPHDPEAEKVLREAQGYFTEGDLDKAAEALSKVVNLEPSYAPAYLHLGEVHMTRQEPEQAIKFFRIATEKDPKDAAGFLLLAIAYGSMEKSQEAVANLLNSLKADPGFPTAWEQLLQLDMEGKKVERLALKFPKGVLWAVEREVKEASGQDLADVAALTHPAWKAYIATRIRWRSSEFSKRYPDMKVYRYTFGEESAAINDMLAAWNEAKAADSKASDSLLDHWLAASQASSLDAAIFTELFLEEFRPEFNAWKNRNPNKFEEYFYKFVLPAVSAQENK